MVVLPTPPFCDAMDRTIGFVLRRKPRGGCSGQLTIVKIIDTTITGNQVDFAGNFAIVKGLVGGGKHPDG